MDPFSIVSGTQAVGRRFSFYITVQATSVLAPGIVDIVGIVLTIKIFSNQPASASTQTLTKDFSGAAAIFGSFILLAAGYVTGYVFRELAFKLLSQLERLPRFQHSLRTAAAHDQVVAHFPPEVIDECFSLHPLLADSHRGDRESPEALGSEQANMEASPKVARGSRGRAGGGHVDDIDYATFVYGKLWIRNYAPGFSIDNIEAEINILVSGLAPTLLVGLIFVGLLHSVWWSVLIGIAIVIFFWWILLTSALRLRRSERKESIRNILLDYSMRQAANKYPDVQASAEN